MLMQQTFNIQNLTLLKPKKKKQKNNHTYQKEEKIKEFLKEWNTIEDVELYSQLYKVYECLFMETQANKLECLNYYIDREQDIERGEEYTVMYAEIKNTSDLPMKERYQKHIDLLTRVISNDITLEHEKKKIYQEEDGQLSIFN